jgi:arylsulfatase A-like enzyme
MAKWAEEKLKSQYTSPFFLAVGFYRPHQPWYAPAKYFEPFEGKEITLPPSVARDLSDCGEAAMHYAHYPWSGSFATVQKFDQWQDALKGYLASVHFVDAQVGRLLDALEASPYKDNTIVVLWGDHGWELGEKEHWGKHTAWEGSMRVPLIIMPPANMEIPADRESGFASLLDLYPTLADLCGLDVPKHLDGESLKPVITGEKETVRDHIVTSLGRSTFSIRKGDMKLIRYYDGSEELYDLKADPHEFNNQATDPSYSQQLISLRKLAPVDARFKQFIRLGQYKAVIDASDVLRLYDMLQPKNGIGERQDVAADHPEIVRTIKTYLKTNKVTERYLTIPSDQPSVRYWDTNGK